MTQLKTMYPGVANSPDTFLVEGLTIDGTVMYVADGAVFGEIPTLAVIGQAELAETVQITGKQSDGGYTIIRGVEGKRQAWAKATNVARNWTNKDYEALRSNITAINDGKVDKVSGKGLSTHDYTDAAKAKVDAIPPDPKYTDTVPDLTPYAKATDLSAEREERKADIVKVRSDHAADINSVRTAHATDMQSVKTDYAKDIQTAKDALTADINNVKTVHDADIKRLESQKLDKTDVINDLTTGGADKALSAEQGKTLFTYADNGKKSIADAIVGKGVDATKSDSFGVLADKISKIKTGYGVGDVLPEESVKVIERESAGPKKIWEYTGTDAVVLDVDSDGNVYCGNSSGKIHKISSSGNKVWTYSAPYSGSTYALDVGKDGYVYFGGQYSSLIKISKTGQYANRFNIGANVMSLAVDSDGYMYVGDSAKNFRLISPSGQELLKETGFGGERNSVTVKNSSFAYAGKDDNAIISFEYRKQISTLSWKNSIKPKALAWSPDGYLYMVRSNSSITKDGLRKGLSWQYYVDNLKSNTFAVGRDSSFAYAIGRTVIKRSSDLNKVFEFSGYTGDINSLAIDSNGDVLIGGSAGIAKVSMQESKNSYKIIK